ncbi:MAG: hypothetical protein KF808_05210 [Cryobacterium sp.]|nr:hypothetical protein [Cryobacterium sp.]
MGLSRKRQRELAKLKRGAADLWEDQKDVLEHATKVVREARRQLANVSREEVMPRVRDVYESKIRPGVESGFEAGRQFADATSRKVSRDLLPAVSSALGTALAALEVVKNPKVREALGKVAKAPVKAAPPAKSGGALRYFLIGVGVVAAAGVAYAAWQTLRADDELWVADEEESPESD